MDLQSTNGTKPFIPKLLWLWCLMTEVEILTKTESENELEHMTPSTFTFSILRFQIYTAKPGWE